MKIAMPSLSFRLRVIERLLRCRFWKSGPSRGPPMGASMPGGDSILITSAPKSASCLTQVGPARTRERSRTRKRASAVEAGTWGMGERDSDEVHRIITCHPGEKMSVREHDLGEIRDAVAKLCAAFPMDYWREKDRERRYPTEFVRALTEAGWLSCLIPEEYGGAGLKLAAAAAILEEIQKSGANGAACHAQMYTMGTVLRHCSEAQKRTYLPKIAKGELRLQAFGITEPSAGSDTSSIRTTAVRKGERYVVNGQKVWTSRAEHSDLMLLFARTTPREQVQKKTDGMSVFLVDMKAALGKGLTIRPIRTMINHATTEIFFDNLEVPAENLVGEEGKGFRYILDGMNAERILIGAECIGDARW